MLVEVRCKNVLTAPLFRGDDLLMRGVLDRYRISDDGLCWWCGAIATTAEHKYKARDLRRVQAASTEGNVSRIAEDGYSGVLRSLRKGSAIRWSVNLCAECNNARSQRFDRSYDQFVDYLANNWEALMNARRLRWRDIYGRDWRPGATALDQYLVKQFGCMMRTENLAVPSSARAFLDGGASGDIYIGLFVDDEILAFRERMMEHGGADYWLKNFIGLPPTQARHDGNQLTGSEYLLRLGYVVFRVAWIKDERHTSMHERASFRIPHLVEDGRTAGTLPITEV
ncbi:hypothetical protein [Dermabacter hominis]|uniref:hypothetical protein n=1 Tax=Dermabacter hominis TaxID=36740 RepID=UPI00242C3183|nr:hypothetical protein [Dermabacter hominis]